MQTTLTVRRMSVLPYVRIARVDHWFKNVFVLLGALLAVFFVPESISWQTLVSLVAALAATCLVASSNYVLNELLDGHSDALHPVKRNRPVPLGTVRPAFAYTEWIALAVVGVSIALAANRYVAALALALWVMGIVYTRISDLAMVLYRQDKSPRLDFWGSDVRSHTTEGDTQWVNYKPSPFSSPSMAF